MERIIRIVLLLGMLVCLFGCENDTGKYFNEWVEKNGNKYYYNEYGERETGWYKSDRDWYYLDPTSGKMVKDQRIDNNYYVDEFGKMLTNTKKEISGTTYEFDNKGMGKEVIPCQFIIDCQFPKTIKYMATGYWYETIIENIKYELKQTTYSKDEYMVNIYITGTAGNSSTVSTFQATRCVGYELYDTNNIKIDSGEFYTYDSLKYGQKFINDYQSRSFFIKRNGIYRLKLVDCNHDWLSNWSY